MFNWKCVLSSVLSAMLLPAGTVTVQGQQDPGGKPPEHDEATQMMVFPLMRIDAGSARQLVQDLGLAVQIVADDRTNSLIIQSSDADSRDQISQLIKVLDDQLVPEVQLLSTTMEITPAAEEVIKTLGESVVQAVDAQRRLIVIKGHEEQVRSFRRTLEELEVFARKLDDQKRHGMDGADQPGFLRVVWLMNGLDPRVTRPVPESMSAAADKLKAVGISELQYLTQLLMNVGASESDFSASGTINAPASIHLSVSGQRNPEGGFSVKITTQQARNSQEPSSETSSTGTGTNQFDSELSASLTLEPGQLVVLGAAPCGGHDSVFVVEFVPQ